MSAPPPSEEPTLPVAPASAAKSDSTLCLLVYHQAGLVVVPLSASPKVVGRGSEADVVVPAPELSRRHLELRLEGERVQVKNLSSSNGTFLNGVRVEQATMAVGDELQLGTTVATLVRSPSAEALLGPQVAGYPRVLELLRARAAAKQSVAVLHLRRLSRSAAASQWLAAVRRALRPSDTLVLHGQSEAIVVVDGLTRALAAELAQRLARDVTAPMVVGLATFPESALEPEALLEQAESAALRAQPGSGVVVAEPGQSPTGTAQPLSLLATGPAMRAVLEVLDRAARSSLPVLLLGETGVGKELLARRLHQGSPRSAAPFRAVNCGAIVGSLLESTLFGYEKGAFTGAQASTRGLFEEADGGTLFLDELGELSAAGQAALLRVLETGLLSRVGSSVERRVDVRVVAATHRDLEARVAQGAFREDLFFRLNTLSLKVPPLRERREDILPLAEHFLSQARAAHGGVAEVLAPEARAALLEYRWPGNARELRNVMHRAAVICSAPTVRREDLDERVLRAASGAAAAASAEPRAEGEGPSADEAELKGQLQRYERELLLGALRAENWNQTAAARRLGMPRRTLVYKLTALGIRRELEDEKKK